MKIKTGGRHFTNLIQYCTRESIRKMSIIARWSIISGIVHKTAGICSWFGTHGGTRQINIIILWTEKSSAESLTSYKWRLNRIHCCRKMRHHNNIPNSKRQQPRFQKNETIQMPWNCSVREKLNWKRNNV